MVFRSKVDLWLAAVMAATAGTSTLGAAVVFRHASAGGLSAGVIIALGAGLPLWVLLGTRYVLRGGILHIRSGPISWHVPVSSISGIEPTRSPISSPALSLSRLRISYGAGQCVLVSPVHPAAFISAINAAKSAT